MAQVNFQSVPLTVQIGKSGITPALIAEIRGQIQHKKTVKIGIAKGAKIDPTVQLEEIALACGCRILKRVGHKAILAKSI